MDGFPKISIVMPTYNRADLIIETVNSVCNQTYPNWELIIVDDGSEDDTGRLVQNLDDPRIQFYKAGRIGIGGRIKNIGLEKATGEVVAFIDSDDLWAATKLEKQVKALQEYPDAGFCLSGGYNFRKKGEPAEFFYKQNSGVRFDHVFTSIFNSEIAVFTQALLFRKDCLHVTGYFEEENSFSDVDFVLRLARHYKAVILYEPLLYRRLHPQNYITSNWEKSYQESVEMIRKYKRSEIIAAGLLRKSLFRLYINYGEKCLLYKKEGQAIRNFLKAWTHKPLSIIPLKKTAKAILYSFS